MPAKITELIDKTDNFEVIRDEIAAILAVETDKQQEFAELAAKDSAFWMLRVFIQRTNPWEEWIDAPENTETKVEVPPIVNVSWDNSIIQMGASDLIEKQTYLGVFHVDVYAYAVAEETVNEYEGTIGHLPGDERAAREVQRSARLIRNILMAGTYLYLGLRGIVRRRWVESITSFQPAIDNRAIQRVEAVRLTLHVEFLEFSPQVQGEPFELLFATVKRSETGEIYFNAQYGEEEAS